MCKMFAAAGPFSSIEPNDRPKFHEFMSNLFVATVHDQQDQDAAGFYSWGGDRRHHARQAGSAKEFVETNKEWLGWKNNPQLLYLCHARGAMSDASNPENNHPFVGDNVALMHEGWISSPKTYAQGRGLSLTTDTDSELYMRIADQRRPSLRNDWTLSLAIMREMLALTSEPTALAFINHSSAYPQIWFGKNKAAGNHEFHFYRIKRFDGMFLTSTEHMMGIAATLSFECPEDEIDEVILDVEPLTVYKMDTGTIQIYKP